MKTVNYPKPLFFLVSAALCWSASTAQAQTAAEEEEPSQIQIAGEQDDDTNGDEEDIRELIFDEDSRFYRLIEDDQPDDWVEPQSQKELDGAELNRLFILYREALDSKAYLEADTLAKRVVELAIKLKGLDSFDSARAITNLGIAQHHNQDYESAMLNFTASIGIIERIDNRLSAALINPLQGLAATQSATGRPDLAKQSYQRAVHVSHVNEGPHNPKQVETLASMAELYIAMGDYDDALDIQENIYALEARNIDPLSLDILPALENKATWQHRLQQYQGERLTWRQVINVIERHQGKESIDLIPPLTNLGKSYLFVSPAEYDYRPDVSTSSGETYLRRANRIADKSPDADWRLVENTLLSLGDYYILSGRPNRAEKIYAEAWQILTEGDDPEKTKSRWEHMERVNVLQKVFPAKYYNSQRTDNGLPPPENFETGTMTFMFSVAPNGRVVGLKNVETQPEELTEFSKIIGRSLRRLIYRPRLNDGSLVATGGVTYTHEFYYRPSDLPSRQQTTPAVEVSAEQAPSPDEEQ